MTSKERAKYFTFLAFRSLVAFFDLLGILAIGFLATSIALFITLGSDSSRVIEFGGLAIPAVTAQTLPVVAVSILGLFVIKAVISILLTRQLAYFLARVEARAARTVADCAFGSGLSEARLHSREEIYFAVQAGSPAAFNAVMNAVGTIVAEGLLFLLVLGSFLAVDPASAFGALVYFALIGAVIQLFLGNLLQKAATKTTEGVVTANIAIGDLSEVLREATIFNKKAFFFDKIHAARIRTAASTASQLTLSGMPRYIVETALMIAVALFVLWQAATGDLVEAAGTLGVFLSGGLRLTASLLPMQSAFLTIKQSIPVAAEALKFLNANHSSETEVKEKDAHSLGANNAVRVELRKVGFHYPETERAALTDIDLEIYPGQQVALVGPSGAGKSTLADLILGLLKPTSGELLIDGQHPHEVVVNNPGRMGYVPQRPGMISGTVSENIALGVPHEEVNLEQLQWAIDSAHLKQVLNELPDGVQTNVGKRKDELSGGQLQRIGLARALYSSPGLLVMDEATSALDAESESEINKALDDMRGRVTVVLIAHRLNTVQRSDLVFLVEQGRITASGTFPELLKTNETVQNLAKLMSIDPLEDEERIPQIRGNHSNAKQN
jgi:ABC-type multidrug transport system fused ATPase/permease subunit